MTRSTGTSGSIAFDVAAAPRDRRAHRGEVDEQRHAGEVLQQDARDDERDLLRARRLRLPARERFDVLVADAPAVEIAQHRFEHDAKAHRQPRDARDAPPSRAAAASSTYRTLPEGSSKRWRTSIMRLSLNLTPKQPWPLLETTCLHTASPAASPRTKGKVSGCRRGRQSGTFDGRAVKLAAMTDSPCRTDSPRAWMGASSPEQLTHVHRRTRRQ